MIALGIPPSIQDVVGTEATGSPSLIGEIITLVMMAFILVGGAKLYDYSRREDRWCPMCQGVRVALEFNGRPLNELCDRHYALAWNSVMRTDGESAETP